MIEDAYFNNKKINVARTYLNEAVFQGAEILYFSFMMNNMVSRLPKEDAKERKAQIKEMKKIRQKIFIKTTMLN